MANLFIENLVLFLEEATEGNISENVPKAMQDYSGKQGRVVDLIVKLNHKLKSQQLELVSREKLLKKKRLLISTISHEIYNPLTLVKLKLEHEMQIVSKKDPFRKISSQIKHELEHLTNLTRDLILLARADTDSVELRISQIRLDKILNDWLQPLRSFARATNTRLEVINHLEYISADLNLLERLIFNLVHNAIKFSTGGVVSLIIQKNKNNYLIEVVDSGSGIEPSLQKDIFKQFYKKGPQQGFGIGLALCDWIVAQHKGRITLNSQPGKGSCFKVVLPSNSI